MTPIEKNVAVVDEQGNKYESTYIKRARGLIKNGRARFIDACTICLIHKSDEACPPYNNLEDNKMLNEMINNDNETEINAPETLTMEWVLNRIDYIIHDTDYNKQMILCLKADSEIAPHIGTMIQSHEETNQKTLELLNKMYNDLYQATIPKQPTDVLNKVLDIDCWDQIPENICTALAKVINNMV
jgi:hypothetical protein